MFTAVMQSQKILGRYFFADNSSRQIMSFRVVNGAATDCIDHTSELDSTSLGTISSFGEDANGELYICGHFGGKLIKVLRDVHWATGDFDGDNDVDTSDFGHLQKCFSGAAIPMQPRCIAADLENDNDVDSADFNMFMQCLSGPNMPP